MGHGSVERERILKGITELITEATALRDAFNDPEMKRQLNNIIMDLGMFDRMLPDRDDLLALVVNQKAGEIYLMRLMLSAYPPNGPKLYGR